MQQPDRETLVAIVNLETNPESKHHWEIILKWFRASLRECFVSPDAGVCKGMGAQLVDLIEYVGSARKSLQDLEKTNAGNKK